MREENSNRNTVVERHNRNRQNTESWASDMSVVTAAASSTSPPRASSQIYMQTAERRQGSTGNRDTQPARLVHHTSFGGKENFSLLEDKTFIGRKEDNQINLKNDPKISKKHAVVERGRLSNDGKSVIQVVDAESTKYLLSSNPRHYLRDRNSSNGVKLNGSYIEPEIPIELTEGDTITIGSIQLVFYEQVTRRPSASEENFLKLVTILPNKKEYEETVTIRTEMEADDVHFKKVSEVGVCYFLIFYV